MLTKPRAARMPRCRRRPLLTVAAASQTLLLEESWRGVLGRKTHREQGGSQGPTSTLSAVDVTTGTEQQAVNGPAPAEAVPQQASGSDQVAMTQEPAPAAPDPVSPSEQATSQDAPPADRPSSTPGSSVPVPSGEQDATQQLLAGGSTEGYPGAAMPSASQAPDVPLRGAIDISEPETKKVAPVDVSASQAEGTAAVSNDESEPTGAGLNDIVQPVAIPNFQEGDMDTSGMNPGGQRQNLPANPLPRRTMKRPPMRRVQRLVTQAT
ncbi:unnamed protein product [Amoebophrya sp. A25]|nr:unnamed protein product [Amoebophrya sp. A25]|eukprot:GSA25T00006944001.1